LVAHEAIAGIVISLIVSLSAPAVAFLIARRHGQLSLLNVAIGAGVFVVFALVIEQAMHIYLLQINHVTASWFNAHRLRLALYAVVAAGVMEESGRYIAMRFLVRPTGNPGTALAYGIGHGGAESALVGALSQVNILVLALMANAGTLNATLVARLSPQAIEKLHGTLAHLNLTTSLMAGFERVVALAAQIAFSFIVWRAVESTKPWLLLVAIASHMFVDGFAALFQAGVAHGLLFGEVWTFLALVAVVLLIRLLPDVPGST